MILAHLNPIDPDHYLSYDGRLINAVPEPRDIQPFAGALCSMASDLTRWTVDVTKLR